MCARGDRDRDRERREDEDEQDQYHGHEGRLGELARGIAQLVDVDGVDLDPGVEEEAVDDQHDARQPVPRREHVVDVQRRRRGVALQQVDRGQQDEQQAGDQRSDEDPVRRQPAGGEHPSGGDQHGRPEQDDDHHGRVEAAVRQAGREHVRQRARDVGEQCRVVEGRLGELTPDRDEAHPRRDPLRHPVVDAARPARSELGRHERRRQQEHDRGHDVDHH